MSSEEPIDQNPMPKGHEAFSFDDKEKCPFFNAQATQAKNPTQNLNPEQKTTKVDSEDEPSSDEDIDPFKSNSSGGCPVMNTSKFPS
jgi:hypothetical protein